MSTCFDDFSLAFRRLPTVENVSPSSPLPPPFPPCVRPSSRPTSPLFLYLSPSLLPSLPSLPPPPLRTLPLALAVVVVVPDVVVVVVVIVCAFVV